MCAYCTAPYWVTSITELSIINSKVDNFESELKALKNKFQEFEGIIKKVKALEDALGGCPCEQPEKTAWLDNVRAQIAKSEEELAKLKEMIK